MLASCARSPRATPRQLQAHPRCRQCPSPPTDTCKRRAIQLALIPACLSPQLPSDMLIHSDTWFIWSFLRTCLLLPCDSHARLLSFLPIVRIIFRHEMISLCRQLSSPIMCYHPVHTTATIYVCRHLPIPIFFYLISNSQSSSWSIAWMRQWGVNNLPKVAAQQRHGRGSNPRPLDRKSDALSHRATPSNSECSIPRLCLPWPCAWNSYTGVSSHSWKSQRCLTIRPMYT